MRIRVNNLSFGYDYRTVLENVSFKVESGDFLVVMGANGSGKTTLVKCLLGINKVPGKKIFIDDIDINQYKNWINIGYVPQKLDDFNYEFPITINEVLSASRYEKGSEDEKLEWLDKLGILELQNENINDLSGGQLQRVFIVRALMNKPKLLILDEPTIGVDTANIERFYKTVNELNAMGVTIMLITHEFKASRANFSHVMNIHQGKVQITSICDLEGDET